MALTPEFRQEIQAAYNDAVHTINTGGEIFYDIPDNIRTVQQFMVSEGVQPNRWNSSFIWQSAILECRKNGTLQERPPAKTQAEIAAERNARLREDGSRAAQSHSRYKPIQDTEEEKSEAKKWLKDVLSPENIWKKRDADKLLQEATQKNEQRTLMESIPADIPFEQYDKTQRAAYKKLSVENMKRVNRLREQWLIANPPAVETE